MTFSEVQVVYHMNVEGMVLRSACALTLPGEMWFGQSEEVVSQVSIT